MSSILLVFLIIYKGISHGLKKCPPDTFSPRRCRGRPFDSLPRQIKKDILSDVLFYLVNESTWDTNAMP